MENIPTSKMYRERPSENITQKIAEIEGFERGDVEGLQLSESERSEISSFENKLGEQLESIHLLKPINFRVHVDYLFTEDGRQDFLTTFGTDFPLEIIDSDSASNFLLENQSKIKEANPRARSQFEGRARSFVEKTISNALISTFSENCEIDASVINVPVTKKLMLTPDKSLKKIHSLRDYKQFLKGCFAGLSAEIDPVTKIKRGVLDLYAKRVNELLAGISQTGLLLRDKKAQGMQLTAEEEELLDLVHGIDDPERVASRYDKFEHGTDKEVSGDGYYRQVSAQLQNFADQYAVGYNESITSRYDQMKLKGLDYTKVDDESAYSPAKIQTLAEEVLASYGLLSAEDPLTYSPDREGSASDGKWQVVVNDKFTSMSASGKQKVVKIPNKAMSATKLFTVGLAHEIEGHVLQHENKANIGLLLFSVVGSDRSGIFAEGGAKYNEDYVSQEAFGVASPPHPHYIRAMTKRQDGGDFKDCVETFYNSAIEPYQELYQEGRIDQSLLAEEAKKNVRLAVNRTRRIFSGGRLESDTGVLTNSKDTVYLEGLVLSEQLKEARLEKYMYLTGVNLDALLFLLKSGLISTTDIQGPHFQSLKIWEREKGRFGLEGDDAVV